jgi:rod shape-determining protein MreC
MRLRKRHAWSAVLIGLFALPVLKPDGVALLEEPVANVVTWPHRSELLRPGSWLRNEADPEEMTPRERALIAELQQVWESHLQYKSKVDDLAGLASALEESGLDRLPPIRIATVLMAHDPVHLRRSITIDRGSDDGVQVGQAVVIGRVLLGRVREVRSRAAIVQLITDPRSRIEVFVRTTANKLLRGYARREGRKDGRDQLRIDFVQLPDDGSQIAEGAPVFSANFDPRVPANLLVGRVSEVSDPDLDRMPTLRVRPALDLDRTTSVIVLLSGRGQAPAPRSKTSRVPLGRTTTPALHPDAGPGR